MSHHLFWAASWCWSIRLFQVMWLCSAPPTDRWSTFSTRADDMWLLTCNQICRWGLKGMILLISTCLALYFSCWRPLVASSTRIFCAVGRSINPSSLNQCLTHVFLWMLPTFPAFPPINTPRQIFIRSGEKWQAELATSVWRSRRSAYVASL